MKILIASFVGALLLSVLNAVTYGLIIPDIVDANRIGYEGLVKDPPSTIPYFLYGLVWMSLLAFAFDRWAKIRSFVRGATAGAIYWGAIVLGLNLNSLAHFNLLENYFVIVPLKVASAAISGAIVGGVMASVLGANVRTIPLRNPGRTASMAESVIDQ